MTTPAPAQPVTHTSSLNIRAIISVLETVAFVVAVILQALGYGSDALVAALIGASGHAVNHPAGGSPL